MEQFLKYTTASPKLVDQMLEAKQQLASAQTERDKTFYENKCATLDREIDELVYELSRPPLAIPTR